MKRIPVLNGKILLCFYSKMSNTHHNTFQSPLAFVHETDGKFLRLIHLINLISIKKYYEQRIAQYLIICDTVTCTHSVQEILRKDGWTEGRMEKKKKSQILQNLDFMSLVLPRRKIACEALRNYHVHVFREIALRTLVLSSVQESVSHI